MLPKDADRIGNSEDSDQTALSNHSFRSSLISVYTVCPDLYFQKLRIIILKLLKFS